MSGIKFDISFCPVLICQSADTGAMVLCLWDPWIILAHAMIDDDHYEITGVRDDSGLTHAIPGGISW